MPITSSTLVFTKYYVSSVINWMEKKNIGKVVYIWRIEEIVIRAHQCVYLPLRYVYISRDNQSYSPKISDIFAFNGLCKSLNLASELELAWYNTCIYIHITKTLHLARCKAERKLYKFVRFNSTCIYMEYNVIS